MAKTSTHRPSEGLDQQAYAAAAATVGNAMMESMMHASQACMQGWLAASEETANFANRRLDADAKAYNKLATCRSYEDIAQVQQAWFSKALEDYAKEWSRLAHVVAESANGKGAPQAGRAKTHPASQA